MTNRRYRTLGVCSVAQFTTTLEFSVSYLALPGIAADLRMSAAFGQWVISAYAVLFAGCLLFGGRLADRFGARRMFLLAILGFGVTSAFASIAWSAWLLVAARAGQGVAAALLQPAVLRLLAVAFPVGPARGRALGVWSSAGALGLAVGTVLGGVLTEQSWRLVFAISVPLCAGCALGVWLGLGRGDRGRDGRPIPVVAAVLGTVSAVAVALVFTLGETVGFGTPVTASVVGVAGLALLGFVGHERAADVGLIDRSLRRVRSLRVGASAAALYMASAGTTYYLLTLSLQVGKGYQPVAAGLAFLPMAVLVTVGSMVAGRAVRCYRAETVLLAGFGCTAVGLGLVAWLLSGDSYVLHLLPGLALTGLGNGLVFTAMFLVGIREVPEGAQGVAGSVLTTAQYLARALAIAVLTIVLGDNPGDSAFRSAFLLTAIAATAGCLVAVRARVGGEPINRG
ncbi:MFS transporter [Tamaricihabitans halophyticus]|uniref:MFS transporter n=1 Tax=Tamaricihabitans halophyticus TaxID=1262583 RepID=A0A4R2QMT7_9PSEU|nr:MFS transporter [Tamaricihabitans halophyticus]TCP50882.1 MFS transporter [Tamaricihabitans halophyticus]